MKTTFKIQNVFVHKKMFFKISLDIPCHWSKTIVAVPPITSENSEKMKVKKTKCRSHILKPEDKGKQHCRDMTKYKGKPLGGPL